MSYFWLRIQKENLVLTFFGYNYHSLIIVMVKLEQKSMLVKNQQNGP